MSELILLALIAIAGDLAVAGVSNADKAHYRRAVIRSVRHHHYKSLAKDAGTLQRLRSR